MQSHRILSALTIFMMVVLVAAGWFLVAQPQLAAADTASTQLADVQSQNTAAQTTIVQLKSQQSKLPELTAQLAALKLSVPSDLDSSAYIRGLNDLATASGVTISGITVSDPQPYAPPASAIPAPTAATSASPTPSPSASASAPVAAPVSTGWTPTTDPAITAANFVAIPVTISTVGGWANDLAFIKGLQSGGRLFLVTSLATSQSADAATPNEIKADISGYIYVVIDPKDAAAAAAAASPTATPTATPTVTPSPSGTATPTPTQSPTPTKKP